LFARLPPIVPRCRTASSPICEASSASDGIFDFTSLLRATAACVVMPPTMMMALLTLTPVSPSFARSTTTLGLFSRCFSTGINVMPPASAFASGSAPSAFTASARLDGF